VANCSERRPLLLLPEKDTVRINSLTIVEAYDLTGLGSSTCTGYCRAIGPAVGAADGLRYDGRA